MRLISSSVAVMVGVAMVGNHVTGAVRFNITPIDRLMRKGDIARYKVGAANWQNIDSGEAIECQIQVIKTNANQVYGLVRDHQEPLRNTIVITVVATTMPKAEIVYTFFNGDWRRVYWTKDSFDHIKASRERPQIPPVTNTRENPRSIRDKTLSRDRSEPHITSPSRQSHKHVSLRNLFELDRDPQIIFGLRRRKDGLQPITGRIIHERNSGKKLKLWKPGVSDPIELLCQSNELRDDEDAHTRVTLLRTDDQDLDSRAALLTTDEEDLDSRVALPTKDDEDLDSRFALPRTEDESFSFPQPLNVGGLGGGIEVGDGTYGNGFGHGWRFSASSTPQETPPETPTRSSEQPEVRPLVTSK